MNEQAIKSLEAYIKQAQAQIEELKQGQEWQDLTPNDVFQEGDEVFYITTWKKVVTSIGEKVGDKGFRKGRRPIIKTPQLTSDEVVKVRELLNQPKVQTEVVKGWRELSSDECPKVGDLIIYKCGDSYVESQSDWKTTLSYCTHLFKVLRYEK